MDLITYRVRRGGRDIHLSPIEFKILRHLLQHPEQVSTREEMKNAAWQANVHVGRRTIDVHVGRLRKALLAVSDRELLRTVWSGRHCVVTGQSVVVSVSIGVHRIITTKYK